MNLRGPPLTATGLDTESEAVEKYAAANDRFSRLRTAGAEVVCGVNATKLDKEQLLTCRPFDRVAFNFPLIPDRHVHERQARGMDVHLENRELLVRFLQTVPHVLAEDGLAIIANKDCYPYSWWRLEAMPAWAGGILQLLAVLPWESTEYPSIYSGPCNVNRDASVKPTDAVIFVFGRPGAGAELRDMEWCQAYEAVRPGRELAAEVPRCPICKPGGLPLHSTRELQNHENGRIHKRRAAMEAQWQARWGGAAAAAAVASAGIEAFRGESS